MIYILPPKETIKNPYSKVRCGIFLGDGLVPNDLYAGFEKCKDAVYSAAKPITATTINQPFDNWQFNRGNVRGHFISFGDYLMDYLKEERK
jgi:hypothetical protein